MMRIFFTRLARWILLKIGREGYSPMHEMMHEMHFWQLNVGKNFLQYTQYPADQIVRPSSGEASSIAWSVWLRIGKRYWGSGEVRTCVRYDDLEIWIAGRGPFTRAEPFIEPRPVVPVTTESLKFIRIRNAAPNQRDASGGILLRGPFVKCAYRFLDLLAGHTTLAHTADNISINSETAIDLISIKLEPTGEPRIEHLYGVPEWMA
jgi:hypothetical protein